MPNGNTPDSVLRGRFYTSDFDYPEWYWQRGFRVADILIMVDDGRTEDVAREVFRRQKTVVATTFRLNAVANLFAHAYFVDSQMLNAMIEDVKSIEHVARVEHSEIIQVVDRRDDHEVRRDVRLLQGGERMRWEAHLPVDETAAHTTTSTNPREQDEQQGR
jgi:hypothetical protein